MKKIITLFLMLVLFSSCLNDREDFNFNHEILPIDSYIVPANFTFGKTDTIKVKYSFPNGCYSFNGVYYEYKDTTRIVAIRSLVSLDQNCTQAIIQGDYNLIVKASQKEDYLFKFYKGKDNNGKSIFEEVVVPVN